MLEKPTEKEEEYFARIECEKRKKAEEERRKKLSNEERSKERELHFMKCPKCGMNLLEIDYKGVKIDRCCECEGVWLDAGELDAVSQLGKGKLERFFGAFR